MSELKLDQEERELLESFEAGEWCPVEDFEAKARQYRDYARATFKKDRRVNIRLSSKDLIGIQKRALKEGVPYQTLIASILHKYVSGTLIERRSES